MYKKILHYALLLLILFSSFFMLSYDTRKENLDDYAYCMAIGIDASKDRPLKLSFQIPSDSSSGSSGSSGGRFGTIYHFSNLYDRM